MYPLLFLKQSRYKFPQKSVVTIWYFYAASCDTSDGSHWNRIRLWTMRYDRWKEVFIRHVPLEKSEMNRGRGKVVSPLICVMPSQGKLEVMQLARAWKLGRWSLTSFSFPRELEWSVLFLADGSETRHQHSSANCDLNPMLPGKIPSAARAKKITRKWRWVAPLNQRRRSISCNVLLRHGIFWAKLAKYLLNRHLRVKHLRPHWT